MSRWPFPRFALAGLLAAAFAAPANASDPCVAPMPRPVVKPLFKIEFDFDTTRTGPRNKGIQIEFKLCRDTVKPPCCAFDCCPACELAVAPMPRAASVPQTFTGHAELLQLAAETFAVEDRLFVAQAVAPMPHVATQGNRLSLPTLPPLGFQLLETPLVKGPFDHGQTVNLSVGIFEAALAAPPTLQTCPPMPTSAAIQRCEGVVLQPMAFPCQTANAACVRVQPTDMRAMYPLVGVTAVRRDETGTWWAEVNGVPQPKQHVQTWFIAPQRCELPVVKQACAVLPPCCVSTPACSTAAKAGELCGTWVREVEGCVLAATFTGNEMKLRFSQCDSGTTVHLTVTAEYAMTKEGLVHGVVTGVDVDVKRDPKAKSPLLANEFAIESVRETVQALVDHPFAFRVKSTSVGMMVSNVKFASTEGVRGHELAVLGGMFKHCKECCVPAPKESKLRTCVLESRTLPSGRYLEKHYPQYFSPDPDFPLQRELASTEEPPLAPCPREVVVFTPTVVTSTPVLVRPAQPANVPTVEFEAMAATFGKMLVEKQATAVPLPMPSVPVQQTGFSVPLNAPALGQPCPLPAAVKPSITGTWVREIGPLVYVVKIAPDHVTITASSSVELPDGKPYCEGIVLTADYHLARDGTTIVGLITSVDALIEGTLPPDVDMPGHGDDLARVQKLLVDKPMAMNLRIYGDVLTIGNVRMPEVEGGACYPLTVLGGRYTQHGESKPLPKPKAVKVGVPRDLLPLTAVPIPVSPATPAPIRQAGGVYLEPSQSSGYFFPPTPIPLPPLPQNMPDTLPLPPTETLPLPSVGTGWFPNRSRGW